MCCVGFISRIYASTLLYISPNFSLLLLLPPSLVRLGAGLVGPLVALVALEQAGNGVLRFPGLVLPVGFPNW